MALFENYERRIDKINGVLAQYGICLLYTSDGGESGEHRAAQQHTCMGFTHVFHLRFQLFETAFIYTMPAVKKQLWYVTKNARDLYSSPWLPLTREPRAAIPVSYTHLDVYKRQAQSSWS